MTEESIFLEALERQDRSKRQEFLNTACTGDDALRLRVEALLRSHEAAAFLRVPALAQFETGASLGAPPTDPANSVLKLLEPGRSPNALGRLSHFEILEILGKGGFGTVLKAFDERLRRLVAIKILSPDLAANASARQRFLREARAAAAVRHDNVVAIYGVDEAPTPHLVMEFIDGPTLEQKLQRTGPLPVNEILRIGMQIALGLAASHKQGLTHRDIKPANILLENGIERVKITDFGLARAVDDASLTQSGAIAGTPQFMSPEQAEGQPVDPRSDLFSLGSVLYAMCTGHPPFRADSALAVLRRVADEKARPIREINPAIPTEIEVLVESLHAKNPDNRVQSAAEVAEHLTSVLQRSQSARHFKQARLAVIEELNNAETARKPGLSSSTIAVSALIVGAALGMGSWFGISHWTASNRQAQHGGGEQQAQSDAKIPKVESGPTVSDPTLGEGGVQHNQGGDTNGGVMCIAVDPSGKMIGSSAATFTVNAYSSSDFKLWDQATGKLVREIQGYDSVVRGAAFSPDGKRIALGCQSGIIDIFDVATGIKVSNIPAHQQLIRGLAWSPDGKWIASASEDMTVALWNVATGKKYREFGKHTGPVLNVQFSPNGERVVSTAIGNDNSARVWDVNTGDEIASFQGPRAQLRASTFTADGNRVVTVGEETNCFVWHAATGKEAFEFAGHDNWVLDVAASSDGKHFATSGLDSTIRIWNAEHGRLEHLCPGHRLAVGCLAFYDDGKRLISGDSMGDIRIWDVATGKSIAVKQK